MDLDKVHSPEQTSQVHAHRVQNNQSRLPSFRFADLQRSNSLPVQPPSTIRRVSANSCLSADTTIYRPTQGDGVEADNSPSTTLTKIASSDSGPGTVPLSTRQATVTGGAGSAPLAESCYKPRKSPQPKQFQENRGPKRTAVAYSINGNKTTPKPLPALSTNNQLREIQSELSQKPVEVITSEWARDQQQLLEPSYTNEHATIRIEIEEPRSTTATPGAQVQPIRAFRPSATRTKSRKMGSRNSYYRYESGEEDDIEDDRDQTLRALQGNYSNSSEKPPRRSSVASRYDDDVPENRGGAGRTGDLFLDLAFENLQQQERADDEDKSRLAATPRRSRMPLPMNRSSLPTPISSSSSANAMTRRDSQKTVTDRYTRGSTESPAALPSKQAERFAYDKGATHNRATSIPQTQADINKSRYPPSAPRSDPTTPRVFNYSSPYDTQPSIANRRGSEPDTLPARASHAYKQSNLSSYSTPRMYNFSSPAAPRASGPGHSDDGSASTTAPSTVWDELDDLKSRLRKLELTTKAPPISGRAVSGSERPPTATTTATTMSTSPKQRARNLSQSYDDGYSEGEPHPLLHAALAKSKNILNTEIYKALETTAQDALAVASMVGSDGRQGYNISSGQSVVGGTIGGSLADRQLRRKADSMCRSLTELCIALSDMPQSRLGSSGRDTARPISRGKELALQIKANNEARELPKTRADTRAVSRFEARRNSLLREAGTPQISPRAGELLVSRDREPAASVMGGRRTSLLLNRRRGAGESEDEEFRRDISSDYQPISRAATEIGMGAGVKRMRPSPVYSSQTAIEERQRQREAERAEREQNQDRERPLSTISSLPVRRTYSVISSAANSPSALAGGRRYLDRERGTLQQERGTNSVMERLAVDRGTRASMLQNMEAAGLNRTRSNGARVASGNETINSTRAEVSGPAGW